MRPASAYIDRKRVPIDVSNDEMKIDSNRPKTATPLRRRREMRRKESENERRRKESLNSIEDEPKLLSSNQLTRLLRSPTGSINYKSFRANNHINNSRRDNSNKRIRPRTAPANDTRKSYRKTHVRRPYRLETKKGRS